MGRIGHARIQERLRKLRRQFPSARNPHQVDALELWRPVHREWIGAHLLATLQFVDKDRLAKAMALLPARNQCLEEE